MSFGGELEVLRFYFLISSNISPIFDDRYDCVLDPYDKGHEEASCLFVCFKKGRLKKIKSEIMAAIYLLF